MGMMINRRRICGGKSLPQGAVDMGLPSGTLWAQGNIVKDAQGNYAIGEPADYGCYFSWGNIDGHNTGDGYSFDDANYALTSGRRLTGNIPNDDALHDAAVANIGGGWCMPTTANFQELFNSNYCTWEWTSMNGRNGYLVTSKTNGNTLFIPAAGIIDGTTIYARNSGGGCWSGAYGNYTYAFVFGIYKDHINTKNSYKRRFGFPIRPVYTPNN